MRTILCSCWKTQLARSFALFFGLFALVNLAGEIWFDRVDANLWWIDFRFLPTAISRTTLLVSSPFLLAFAIRPPRQPWRRALTAFAAGLLAFVAVLNAGQFYLLVTKGSIVSGLPIAFSLFVAVALSSVAKLIFSGGPGDGTVSETEAMRRMAVSLGVKDEDIVLDAEGLNTERTVRNSIKICDRLDAKRVLAVSHFYHLPRIKMAYQKCGREVYTVPARERYFLRQTPYSVAREIVAFWAYYFRPLV